MLPVMGIILFGLITSMAAWTVYANLRLARDNTISTNPWDGSEAMGRLSTLRVMTYNIHHGVGIEGAVDLDQTAALLGAYKPDIVFLTEVDRHWRRSGFADQARLLARKLAMPYTIMAPALVRRNWADAGVGGTAWYGNALLSRYPVVWSQITSLPSIGWTEPRVALTAHVQLTKNIVLRVIGTHLGLNHNERMTHIETLRTLASEWPGPSLLLGDFNTDAKSPELRRLMETDPTVVEAVATQSVAGAQVATLWIDPAGTMASPTFPAHQPTRRIDFILVSPELASQVIRYDSPASSASDHLPVVADISFD